MMSHVRKSIFDILVGVMPERESDILSLFEKYNPQFSIVDETHKGVVLRAGGYFSVEFNHRAMLTFWIGAHIIWRIYSECAHAIVDGSAINQKKINSLFKTFQEIQIAEDPDQVNWPLDVLKPGDYGSEDDNPEKKMGPKLATFAVGWAILHEIRHLQIQQEGSSSPITDVKLCHEEELDCDSYAANFIMANTKDYSHQSGEDQEKVELLRKLGILIGVFVIGLLSNNPDKSTDTHPSEKLRLKALIEELEIKQLSKEDAIIQVISAGFKECGFGDIFPF